jgi:hypothetical protein
MTPTTEVPVGVARISAPALLPLLLALTTSYVFGHLPFVPKLVGSAGNVKELAAVLLLARGAHMAQNHLADVPLLCPHVLQENPLE